MVLSGLLEYFNVLKPELIPSLEKMGSISKYAFMEGGFSRIRGHQLMKSAEFVQIAEKNMADNVHKNGEFVDIILPKNEGQVRPLLEKLEHNGERMKGRMNVWTTAFLV